MLRTRFMLAGVAISSFFIDVQAKDAPELARRQEFFESKVRPILARNCFACHTDTKMGGLQLDTRERVLKGGNSGPAVVPGDLDHSLLIKAVNHTDPRIEMPPPGKLSNEQISILETWVKDGAIWGLTSSTSAAVASHEYLITPDQRAFWSFQPMRKPVPPKVKNRPWVKSPIDSFILAKTEANGLRPVRPASKTTLIRRATLDLIGLPPTPSEIDDFLRDKSPQAFAKVVDRLLASPHYGERWGRYWLDVARYSDDQLMATEYLPVPNAFRYRDWVVEAFNKDMPYDQFIKAQIAGDLLPNVDRKEFVGGLGFYALSPNPDFHEDRVDVMGRGFLGLTVACAQCHDHKYDPIPTKDYYALLGVFESTEADEFPVVPPLAVTEYKKHKKVLDEQKEALKKFLDTQRVQLVEILAEKTEDYMKAVWRVLGPEKKSPEEAIKEKSLDREVLGRWRHFLEVGRKREYGFLEAWQRLLERQEGSSVEVDGVVAEFQNRILAVLKEKVAVDEKNAKSMAQVNKGQSPEVFALERDSHYLLQDLAAAPTSDVEKTVERGVLYFADDEIARFLSGVWKEHFETLQNRIVQKQAELPEPYPFFPTIRDKEKPANIHVYLGGDKENKGEEAPRRFLSILSGEKPALFEQGSGRLELAEAIANPHNPLTARVMANRIWLYHFGRGIVSTPSNFGCATRM